MAMFSAKFAAGMSPRPDPSPDFVRFEVLGSRLMSWPSLTASAIQPVITARAEVRNSDEGHPIREPIFFSCLTARSHGRCAVAPWPFLHTCAPRRSDKCKWLCGPARACTVFVSGLKLQGVEPDVRLVSTAATAAKLIKIARNFSGPPRTCRLRSAFGAYKLSFLWMRTRRERSFYDRERKITTGPLGTSRYVKNYNSSPSTCRRLPRKIGLVGPPSGGSDGLR